MVVITIIAILSGIVLANMSGSRAKGRNLDRQADLIVLQAAIEQYKQETGRYPAMGVDDDSDGFSSERETTAYIVGLTPDYLSRLPKDPTINSGEGYAYVTNTNGTVYKLLALGTVESETVTSNHKMKSCDTTVDICNGSCGIGASLMAKTYALWGGYADAANAAAVKTATAAVICR